MFGIKKNKDIKKWLENEGLINEEQMWFWWENATYHMMCCRSNLFELKEHYKRKGMSNEEIKKKIEKIKILIYRSMKHIHSIHEKILAIEPKLGKKPNCWDDMDEEE